MTALSVAHRYRRAAGYLVLAACVMGAGVWTVTAGPAYIIPPIDFSTPTPVLSTHGWAARVASVSEKSGSLHVDIAIVNETGDWSAMDVASSKARVVDSGGKTTNCSTVFVGTSVFVNDGGWYLPPGFVMKGYTGGSVDKPVTQPLYVECSGVAQANAKRLQIDYSYITGPFNYYTPSHRTGKTFDLDLSKPATDLTYPIADQVDGLVQKSDIAIKGINDYTVQLDSAKRTATGLEFTWKSTNPSLYAGKIFIGVPPVIGSDGILYGFYQSPHLEIPPTTPANGEVTWTTTVTVPSDAGGFYILLPLETKQNKYFVDHVVDITDR